MLISVSEKVGMQAEWFSVNTKMGFILYYDSVATYI